MTEFIAAALIGVGLGIMFPTYATYIGVGLIVIGLLMIGVGTIVERRKS